MSELPRQDIIMLQSLNCKENKLPRIEGYQRPSFSLESDRVMVATYIHKNLVRGNSDVNFTVPDVRFSHCIDQIVTKDFGPINFVNVYYPAGSNSNSHVSWIENLNPSKNWFIGGDFNVHNSLWDRKQKSPTVGVHLSDAIINSPLTICNDGSFTRLGQMNQTDSAVDLSLISSNLAKSFNWDANCNTLLSDHLPILIEVGDVGYYVNEPDKSIKFDDKNFDESEASSFIANYLGTNHNTFSCDLDRGKKLIETMFDFYDEPFADISSIPSMLLSSEVRRHVSVALTRDGAD